MLILGYIIIKYRKKKNILVINPLLPTVPYMTRLAKILILI